MMAFKKQQKQRRFSLTFNPGAQNWRTSSRLMSKREMFELLEDDTDSEEETMVTDKYNWEDSFDSKSVHRMRSEQDMEVYLTRKQTLILATLLPDEIILSEKFENMDTRKLVGVLLMADVSGYTALSEKYGNTGKGGTYRLTFTLNTYLGGLIELIYSHGGDVIKFAGDAFLALWKTDKSSFICHTIHKVVACALVIQHSYATYETDVKVNLKVKLAISAGNLIFTPIGKGIDMSYVVYGLPVIEAKLAESLCTSGEVKLTPTAWGHCYSRNYDYVMHEDGHVTIRAILYDPREKDVSKPFAGINTLLKSRKTQYTAIEQLPDVLLDNPINLSPVDLLKKNEALSLRKTILVAEDKNNGSEFRKFMIRPILTQIDAHQPLEYLTEMRQVSILFITLKPMECPYMQLITIVNNSYEITCEIVYKSMGCVNKIILFDKDVMILVIFGLRGFKHESEAQAALKCAHGIKKSVSALDGVKEVSIGITTGQVYCGVVGHPLRREFTVIGAIVNKAARLMCGYRNRVTCDETTFVKSKMSKNGFTLLPPIDLKGIAHPGKVYEYSEEIRLREMYDIKMIPRLLDRKDELDYFAKWLEESKKSYKSFDALMLIGEARTGKSRLLEWMARCARNKGFKVCYINLTSIHSVTPYLALSQLINQILQVEDPVEGFVKEEKIVNLLKMYTEDLCYLNDIIKVRFAFHEGMTTLAEKERKNKAKEVFSRLIAAVSETYVIFLDDLQNLDPMSWDLLSVIINYQKMFTVFTVTRMKFGAVHKWLYNVFISSNIRKILLNPLNNEFIAPLACQILDVDAVSEDLCCALKTKCKGIPGVIETFILHLFSNGALEIKKITKDELPDYASENLQFPPSDVLHPQALDSKDQGLLDEYIDSNSTNEISICIVTLKDQLNTNLEAQNADAMIMIQIDSLTPYQQLLLKIASVIGYVFSRILLESIMYENNAITTAKAIKRLFSMRLISCANNKYPSKRTSVNSTVSVQSSKNYCECNFEHDPEENENLPKYAFCKLLKFRNRNTKKTCYELLPINQKKEFHSRIVHYLENNKQKCVSCGGSVMIAESLLSLSSGPLPQPNKLNIREEVPSSSSSDELLVQTQRRDTSFEFRRSILSTRLNDKSDSITDGKPKRVTLPTISLKGSVHALESKSALSDNHDKEDVTDNNNLLYQFRPIMEAVTREDWKTLGIDNNTEQKTQNQAKRRCCLNVKLEKGLSKTNFETCSCAELEIVMFEQLIFHAEQAELKRKIVEFQLKYVYLNILANAPDVALPKLDEAEAHIGKHDPTISSFDRRRLRAKMFALKAASYLLKQDYAAAKTAVDQANEIYRIYLHRNKLFKKIIYNVQYKLPTHREFWDCMKRESLFCLNVTCILYSYLHEETATKTAMQMALKLIRKFRCDIPDTLETFSNALQIEIDRGTPGNTAAIECLASEAIRTLRRPLKSEELFSFGKLCVASFKARIARGYIFGAVRSGFRAIVTTRFLFAENITLDIIPELFYVLVSQRYISEAIDLVKETMRLGQRRTDIECETWYYALCMDLVLDAGFQLESPYAINRFAETTLSLSTDTHTPGYRRLIIGLWTYWLRAGFERRARRYETESLSWAGLHECGSLTSLISAMRLAEGMLESLARKMEDLRKVVNVMELRSLADAELTKIERDSRTCQAIHPRWMLLKAYSYYLSGRTSSAIQYFSQALEESNKLSNHLEAAAAKAATMTKSTWVECSRNGNFVEWQAATETINTAWHTLMYRMNRP